MEKDPGKYQVKEPKLEPPAEANRDKQVNFRAAEEGGLDATSHEGQNDYSADRRRQWEQGLQEGRKAQEKE